MKMKRLPSEANCGRVSDRGKEGGENDMAAAALPTAKPNLMDGAQRSQTCEPKGKNRIEGRYGTTSWHNTAKSSGLPVEVNAVVAQGRITLLPEEWGRSGHGGPD